VGFLDTLLGRTKPVQPKLDDLFALPSAAVTLEAGAGFTPTGSGSVCFRPVEGRSFADVQKDVTDLLDMSAGQEGALLTGQPSALKSALVKVSGGMAMIPDKDLRAAEPLNAFYFAPALAPKRRSPGGGGAGGGFNLSQMFSTHPSLERRIAELDKIQRQLGR